MEKVEIYAKILAEAYPKILKTKLIPSNKNLHQMNYLRNLKIVRVVNLLEDFDEKKEFISKAK